MKTVYAFLADGMEEVEALMVIDLLRRTNELDVVTVSIKDDLLVESSHNIKLYADKLIKDKDFEKGDCIFLPGGMPGTTNLEKCGTLLDHIKKYNEEGKWLTAICAAPSVLGKLGILEGKDATCYPGFEGFLNCKNYGGQVVRDGNIITAKALGAALELGLEMISCLVSEEASKNVASAIHYNS